MNDEQLILLLFTAQSEFEVAEPPPGYANRLRALNEQRASRRRAVAASLLSLVLVGGALVGSMGLPHAALRNPHAVATGPSDRDLAALCAEVESLDAQRRHYQEVAQAISELSLASETAVPQVYDDSAVDRTAAAMLLRAERAVSDPQRASSAIDAYRQLVHLFPETPWAQRASARLAAMQN